MNALSYRTLSLALTMISVIPMILLLVHSMWFMYVGGLPDMITIKLATKPTFYITFISLIALVINFAMTINLTDKMKV